MAHPLPEFRCRLVPPKTRSHDRVLRISLGPLYRDFTAARALALSDKIVDLIEQWHRE